MKSVLVSGIVTLSALGLAGCISFARMDGARTVPVGGSSISAMIGGSAAPDPRPNTSCGGEGRPDCSTRPQVTDEEMEHMYFSPTNNTLDLQATGRLGLSKNIDCGGTISLYALGADCKWNWYRGDWFATAISLGGSGTWAHISVYSKYTYYTAESHFPVELSVKRLVNTKSVDRVKVFLRSCSKSLATKQPGLI